MSACRLKWELCFDRWERLLCVESFFFVSGRTHCLRRRKAVMYSATLLPFIRLVCPPFPPPPFSLKLVTEGRA